MGEYHYIYPKHRGELTLSKIINRIKSVGSLRTTSDLFTKIYKRGYEEISKFDSPQDLMDNVYWHGTGGYISGGLKAGFTQVKNGRGGGGGYGEMYHSISVTKNKNVARNFAGESPSVSIHPVLLRKGAHVESLPDVSDSIEIEDRLIDLWLRQVDAVQIGNWGDTYSEQELVVLNPRALLLFYPEYHQVYQMPRMENPSLEVYTAIYNTVQSNPIPVGKDAYIEVNYTLKESIIDFIINS